MKFARLIGDILISLLMLGGPVLLAFTYTGPYKWFAELQLLVMGEYYETLTFLLTVLIWILGCGAVLVLVKRLRGVNAGEVETVRASDSVTGRMLPAIAVVAILIPLGLSGYFEYRYKSTHGVTHVSMNDISQKHWWPGDFIAIDDADADPQFAVQMSESSGGPKSTTCYLPLIPDGYVKGQPIHAVVEVNMDRLHGDSIDPRMVSKGVVNLMGLPGMVRVQLERNGNPPTMPIAVITYGSSEEQLQDNVVYSLSAAGGILVISIITIFRVRKMQQG